MRISSFVRVGIKGHMRMMICFAECICMELKRASHCIYSVNLAGLRYLSCGQFEELLTPGSHVASEKSATVGCLGVVTVRDTDIASNVGTPMWTVSVSIMSSNRNRRG